MTDSLLDALNGATPASRLEALREVAELIAEGVEQTVPTIEVNNHVHTFYSFSPYSPAMVAFRAWKAGLQAVGIMDHDSVAGAEEMIEACKLLGIGSTVGCEVRVNFTGSKMEGRKINNPDSSNIVYISLHGIPRTRLDEVAAFLRPIGEARGRRNREMVARLNSKIAQYGLQPIDYDRDVVELSHAAEGGSITERHILSALSAKIIQKTGRGTNLVSFLEQVLNIGLAERVKSYLIDEQNPHYIYDLLGALKSSFLPEFFIQPTEEECVSVYSAVEFGNSIGAIPCYAYLGDVTESPTGDKKAEKFEDEFLDELIAELKQIGFKAVTYMPPRNTREQLDRVRALCHAKGLMEISGVDINSSRQSFSCPEILDPAFHHLIESTWALIAHEKLASVDQRYALFDAANPLASANLPDRIAQYAELGKGMDPRHPEEIEFTAEV